MTSIQSTKQTLIDLASIANREIYLNKTLHAEIAQKQNILALNKKLFSHITKSSQIQTELLTYNKSIHQLNQRIFSLRTFNCRTKSKN